MAPGGISWGDTPKAFLEGQTASMWTSTGNLAFIKENAEFDWGVGFLPGGDGPGAPIGGGNFYIFQDTTDEEREAALDFIKFMTSPESAAKWSIATGYVAPRPDTWETPEMKAYAARLAAGAGRSGPTCPMPNANSRPSSARRSRSILVDAIESVVTGSIEPAAALAKAQEDADKVLGDYK